MIKKIIFAIGLLVLATGVFSQAHRREQEPNTVNTYSDNSPADGFGKENLFVGGSLALGFSSYNFNAGISPEIGYSLTNWLDAGLLVNLNYSSIRADPSFSYNNNTRQRSFNYGVGAFARFYPIDFLFFQAQPEYNWIDYQLKNMSTGQTASAHAQAMSLLAGIGYGQRIRGRSGFYIAIMLDLLSNPGSPYRDLNRTPLPVFKGGFDIYLHPNR